MQLHPPWNIIRLIEKRVDKNQKANKELAENNVEFT